MGQLRPDLAAQPYGAEEDRRERVGPLLVGDAGDRPDGRATDRHQRAVDAAPRFSWAAAISRAGVAGSALSATTAIGGVAQLGDRRVERLLVTPGQDDPRPLRDQLLGRGAAQAARTAGDEEDPVLQLQIHGSTLG